MNYFSGFLFENEQSLFSSYIPSGDFVVAGFSYGAIKAFEYTLATKNRVDRLVLISPAFFQDTSPSFKRMQMRHFGTKKEEYIKNFISNLSIPNTTIDLGDYICDGTEQELDELLNYKWSQEGLRELASKDIDVEVFLGMNDAIVNSKNAYEFFKNFCTVYCFKDGGHLLNVK